MYCKANRFFVSFVVFEYIGMLHSHQPIIALKHTMDENYLNVSMPFPLHHLLLSSHFRRNA